MAETKDVTKKVQLPSGAVLHLGRPEFGACGRLKRALANAAGGRPFSPEEMKMGLDELVKNPSAGGSLASRLLTVFASEEVEKSIFDCLAQATYQPAGVEAARIKVNPALLDHPDFGDGAREDFYPICFAAGEAALSPFLGALVSAYKVWLGKKAENPASKSSSPPSAS